MPVVKFIFKNGSTLTFDRDIADRMGVVKTAIEKIDENEDIELPIDIARKEDLEMVLDFIASDAGEDCGDNYNKISNAHTEALDRIIAKDSKRRDNFLLAAAAIEDERSLKISAQYVANILDKMKDDSDSNGEPIEGRTSTDKQRKFWGLEDDFTPEERAEAYAEIQQYRDAIKQ